MSVMRKRVKLVLLLGAVWGGFLLGCEGRTSVLPNSDKNMRKTPAQWAADAINYVLDGILNEKAVHLCFGNYGGQPMLRGFWRDMVPFLNRLRTDHLVLEFARRGYDELEVLNDLDRRIKLGIGVVDIKDNEVESPELIASRIDHIVKTVGPNRLKYVHPDCGFWMLQRSVVDRKIRALVAGRDLFEGSL